MQMPFGKYSGDEIEDIPLDYLEWLLQNVELRNPDLRFEVESMVGESAPDFSDRQGTGWKRRASGGTRTTTPPTVDLHGIRTRLADAVARWRGQMARRFHPDRGGDPEVMKEINKAADDLTAAVDEATKRP